MMYEMQLTLVTGPLKLSRKRFIPMANHESENTYTCIGMDNTRISEKIFFVPLGFGGYLLTIDRDLNITFSLHKRPNNDLYWYFLYGKFC